jgi:ATP-dependent Zn protease
LAARKGRDAVEMADFDEAIDRIVGGLEKKTRVMNPAEKETVAYHEAGHALVAESRPRASVFLNISKPQRVREYSEQTAQAIDEEIRKLLADAHTRVEQTLATRRSELDALANLLLEKEVVDREALTQPLRPQQS